MFNLKISFRNIAVILTLVFSSQFGVASTLKFDSSIIKSIKKFNPGVDNKSRLEIFPGDKEALKLVYNLGSGKRNSAIYDFTPVLKQTGDFSKNSQLNFEITGSKNANIVVHLLDSSGRWYLFRRKVLVDRKQFIRLRANLQEYSQSWGKGCHGVFVYPLQKLRFGVEGSGQGYVVISKFGIEPFIALHSFNGSKSPCPSLHVLDRIKPVKFQLTDPKIINVMDYGAVPNDGKPDESAVIKAIKAAGKYKSTIVRFPKGTYHFSIDF